MYYKVLKNNKVIDVLDQLIFLRYQPKHKIFVLCDENVAQAFLGSDGNSVYHEVSMYALPISGYDTVKLQEISKNEYTQLKLLNLKTYEEIIDSYTTFLIEEAII